MSSLPVLSILSNGRSVLKYHIDSRIVFVFFGEN